MHNIVAADVLEIDGFLDQNSTFKDSKLLSDDVPNLLIPPYDTVFQFVLMGRNRLQVKPSFTIEPRLPTRSFALDICIMDIYVLESGERSMIRFVV